MKIVFIGGRDIHKLGGIENYMYNLASELVRQGHEPIVFCESDHDGEEVVNGFRVIHQKGPKSRFLCKPLLGIKSTWRAIREIRDVDMIHYNAAGPAKGSWLARLFGIPELMQGHGLEWERPKYTRNQQRLIKFFDTTEVRLNSHIIMCSEVQTNYWEHALGKHAVTIPTAINLPDFSRQINSDIMSRFGIKQKKYLLFLARLVQDKNPHYLIRAFNEVSDSKNMQLVIAGDNPSDEKFVNSLHVLAENNPNIIFTGAVYGDDKEMLLREATAFCVPSTIEGLSISLLEGMGYNLPIIASQIPANQEVLKTENAFWCIPEDVSSLRKAIEEFSLAGEKELLRKTTENRKLVEENYTWPKVTEKYVKTIMNFINQK